jgi:hypothetical protein
MPCDAIARGNTAALQARKRALDGLAKRLAGAQVETEAADYAGNTAFRAVTLDGYVLSGTLDSSGVIRDVRMEGWSLQERAGWCDECSLEALRDSPEVRRIVREVQAGGSGIASYGRDAILIGRK